MRCAAPISRDLPTTLELIGEAAAGHPFGGMLGPGQAVRIFTGAPVPAGTDAIVIQEEAERDGAKVRIREGTSTAATFGPRGSRFQRRCAVARRPVGALARARCRWPPPWATAAERAPPPARWPCSQRATSWCPRADAGAGADRLLQSSGRCGDGGSGRRRVAFLGIARDLPESLVAHFAKAGDADVFVTIGGASVGDHDLVAPVLTAQGMALSFWKIAMRPGKPLMFGRLRQTRILGLPGNPVSALVCARLFLVPLLRALLGLSPEGDGAQLKARSAVALEANGPREHYMRAIARRGDDGLALVTPVRSQDSSLLSPLAEADCLLVRPAGRARRCPRAAWCHPAPRFLRGSPARSKLHLQNITGTPMVFLVCTVRRASR